MNILEALESAKKDGRKIRRQWWVKKYVMHIDLRGLFTSSINGQFTGIFIPVAADGKMRLLRVPSGLVCISDTHDNAGMLESWRPEVEDLDAQDWELVPVAADVP